MRWEVEPSSHFWIRKLSMDTVDRESRPAHFVPSFRYAIYWDEEMIDGMLFLQERDAKEFMRQVREAEKTQAFQNGEPVFVIMTMYIGRNKYGIHWWWVNNCGRIVDYGCYGDPPSRQVAEYVLRRRMEHPPVFRRENAITTQA